MCRIHHLFGKILIVSKPGGSVINKVVCFMTSFTLTNFFECKTIIELKIVYE